MTLLQALKSLTIYPIPSATLQSIAEGSGISTEEEATQDLLNSPEMKRATAKVYLFLVTAPNVSQNGISYSFTASERRAFQKMARSLLEEIGEDTSSLGGKYGYMGSRL